MRRATDLMMPTINQMLQNGNRLGQFRRLIASSPDSCTPGHLGADPIDSMLSPPLPQIRCRQIGPTDLEAIADLLAIGFPRRSRSYWVAGLKHLSDRSAPDGFPRYGYMLENGNRVLGVLLMIFASMRNDGAVSIRCNISSWYVAPEFRIFGSMMVSQALKHPVTYLNISPARHTFSIIEAQRFSRFCEGTFAAVPVLARGNGKTRISRIKDPTRPNASVPLNELQLLGDHERFGCINLWCETRDGGYPLIFRRRFVKGLPLLPCAQLIYCRSMDDLMRDAGPIGRFLALRGMPLMLMPANDRVPHLAGWYCAEKPMYYQGPNRPRLGDLAYTEAAVFGI